MFYEVGVGGMFLIHSQKMEDLKEIDNFNIIKIKILFSSKGKKKVQTQPTDWRRYF